MLRVNFWERWAISSVPNSSDELIFEKRRAFLGQKYGHKAGVETDKTQVFVILSSFCDLVHAQGEVHLFAKRSERAQNHK